MEKRDLLNHNQSPSQIDREGARRAYHLNIWTALRNRLGRIWFHSRERTSLLLEMGVPQGLGHPRNPPIHLHRALATLFPNQKQTEEMLIVKSRASGQLLPTTRDGRFLFSGAAFFPSRRHPPLSSSSSSSQWYSGGWEWISGFLPTERFCQEINLVRMYCLFIFNEKRSKRRI